MNNITRNTQDVGDLTQVTIMAALLKSGKKVLLPVGENHRFDLVFYDAEGFYRVQCKTGRYHNGTVVACVVSVVRNSSTDKYERRAYQGEVDFFGIYCPQVDKCYLVPMDIIGSSTIALRVEEPLRQNPNIKWAVDYEL